jgi:hypothetical protein
MEALGKAARAAVESFEEEMKVTEDAKLKRRQRWADEVEEEEVEEEEEAVNDWSTLTIAELRTELKRRGLKSSGSKTELVDRLQEDDIAGEEGEMDDMELSSNDEDDDPDEDFDISDFDVEELGRQARAAVRMFQSGPADFDEEPTEEMLAQLENEMAFNGEFLDEPTSGTNFSSMTVAELKEECRNRGLKVGGKKSDLIERLQSTTE